MQHISTEVILNDMRYINIHLLLYFSLL